MASVFREVRIDAKLSAQLFDNGTITLFRYGHRWLKANSATSAAIHRIATLEDALEAAKRMEAKAQEQVHKLVEAIDSFASYQRGEILTDAATEARAQLHG